MTNTKCKTNNNMMIFSTITKSKTRIINRKIIITSVNPMNRMTKYNNFNNMIQTYNPNNTNNIKINNLNSPLIFG